MKVIFLDVDGVLNSQQLFEKCEDDQLISVGGRCNIGSKYVCKDGPVFRCDEIDELPAEY